MVVRVEDNGREKPEDNPWLRTPSKWGTWEVPEQVEELQVAWKV